MVPKRTSAVTDLSPSGWGTTTRAHSAYYVPAAARETANGDRTHHRQSPSHAAPDPPIYRAFPSTAHAAFDTALPVAHGILGVVACLVPILQAGTSNGASRSRIVVLQGTPST